MEEPTRGWRHQQAAAVRRRVLLEGEPLIVGLDLAEGADVARLETSTGVPVAEAWLRTPAQRAAWWRRVEEHRAPAQRVLVGMEPTGVSWKLAWVEVSDRGFTPILVQPLAVRRASEQLDYQRAKSDPRDAALICRLVRHGDVTRTRLPEEPWASLRSLAAKRWALARQGGAARQEVRSLLQLAFPAYLRTVRTLDGLTSLAMLRAGVDPTAICALSPARWARRVSRELRGTRRLTQRLVRAVHEASREPGGVESERAAACLRITLAVERWDLLRSQVARLDTALTELLERTPYATRFAGLRGLSRPMLASILGLLGDPADYDHARAVVRVAGLNPRPWSSGAFHGRTALSYAGRSELRTACWQTVFSLIRHDPAFGARHRYLTHRSERPLTAKQSVSALSAKLLRTIWCVATGPYAYDVQRAWPGGVPLAA